MKRSGRRCNNCLTSQPKISSTMMTRYLTITLVSLIFLSGCMLGPNYQKPTLDTPESFIYDSLQRDTVVNLAWWEMFQDEQLHELITVALVENRNVRIAAARIEEARAFYGFTKADIYPWINYGASYTHQNFDPNSGNTGDAFGLGVGGLNLNWEIDFWGKFRRANESARAELLASEYGRRAVQVGLISEVANTYFTMLMLELKLDISRNTLKSREESLRIIQERFNKGYSAEIDLNQSQVQMNIARASIPLYERELAMAENRLNVLMGRNPGSITRGKALYEQVFPPEIPPGIPSDLLIRRPDIQEAEQLLIAQNARIGVAEAMRFPSISLTGMLGGVSPDLSGFSAAWSVGGSVAGPLLNFGKNKRRVEMERHRTVQVQNNYEQTVLMAFQEVENALIEIETLQDEFDARAAQMEAAANAAMLSNERYNGGVTSYLEVLDSERTLFNSELSAATTKQQQFTAYIKLYKSLGGGWITEEEREQANNVED